MSIQFNNNDYIEQIEDFTLTCESCGSTHTTLLYNFQYYSAATGYDQDIIVKCESCGNTTCLNI